MANGKSCRGCSEKCLRTHFYGHGSSFFKVMAGDFSSVLEVPSDYFKQSPMKGCRNATLEGPSGHSWYARLHCHDNISFFKEGWEIFVSDHCIQRTDITVFRRVNVAHFLVQIFEASGYEKINTSTIKNCESHNVNKLGIYCTEATTFRQSFKGNEQKRSAQGMGVKVEITGNCTEAYISNVGLLSTRKHEFHGHPKTNVKHEPGLPKLNCHFSENQVGSCVKHPIILDSDEEYDSQASLTYSTDQDTEAVFSEVLQEKVSSLKEGKTSNSVKKDKPKFTRVMNKSAVAHSFWLGIPRRFGKCWFPRANVEVLLLHQTRKWPVLFVGERSSCGLGPGWKYFAVDNELKIGDTCIFELEDKASYILKVHIQR